MNIADAFFEKFDLLPIEYKRQLDNGVSAPTLEDVDAMWELLQEEQGLQDLINKVNKRFYPERIAEQKKLERERYRKQREAKRREYWDQKYRAKYVNRTILNPHYRDPSASDLRLIGEAQAHAMVTRGKAKVVNTTDEYITQTVFVGYETPKEKRERMRREEIKKFGYDPYVAPDKKPMIKANVNKRLDNTF
jgi:hypothetical protein